jgi:hypothetical protein
MTDAEDLTFDEEAAMKRRGKEASRIRAIF